MRLQRIASWQPLVLLLCVAPSASIAEAYAPEVYRDANLIVHAGIATRSGQIVHFGDVLSLVIVISWNGEKVTLEEPGHKFFTSAWPAKSAPVLIDVQETRGAGTGVYANELGYVFRFQIVSCPGEAQTCPGDRDYLLPEFTLRYRTEADSDPVPIKFRPEPGRLTIITALARNAEDRLYPFSTYFPTGAYPDPLPVLDRTQASLATLGIGSLILIGGLLMWPFRFRKKQLFGTREEPRWQVLLREVQQAESEDERRVADRMRRCLVWYCSDSLRIDPLNWLSGTERDRQDQAHPELRALFIDLLHDPAGRVPELRNRLTAMVAGRT